VFIEAKDNGSDGDYWSYRLCKAPVKSSLPTNQHPVLFTGWMSFLSPNQHGQSTEGKISHSMYLLTPSLPGGLPTLSLTTILYYILYIIYYIIILYIILYYYYYYVILYSLYYILFVTFERVAMPLISPIGWCSGDMFVSTCVAACDSAIFHTPACQIRLELGTAELQTKYVRLSQSVFL